jgi:hypothetical protein
MRLIGQRGPQLAAFVDEWWPLYAERDLEPATLLTYRWVWEQHARPYLGAVRLRDVTLLTMARFRAEREAAGAGVETIRKTYTMLGSVFSCAVEWQLVDRNPCERPGSRGQRSRAPRSSPSRSRSRRCAMRWSPAAASPPFSCSSRTRACVQARRSRSNGATSESARW